MSTINQPIAFKQLTGQVLVITYIVNLPISIPKLKESFMHSLFLYVCVVHMGALGMLELHC
jgi:hypothetical protein